MNSLLQDQVLILTISLLNAAAMVFNPKQLVKVPQQGLKQLVFLQSVGNSVNRPLEQQAMSSIEAAAPGVCPGPAQTCSKKAVAVPAKAKLDSSNRKESDQVLVVRVAR